MCYTGFWNYIHIDAGACCTFILLPEVGEGGVLKDDEEYENYGEKNDRKLGCVDDVFVE